MLLRGRYGVHLAMLMIVLLAALTLSACDRNSITFVSAGAEYALSGVDELRESIPVPDYGADAASRAKDLRHDRLVELRAEGDEAATAADLLTQEFPNEERAVPYYVEAAVVDGVDAWVVLEVVGSDTGSLDRIRLWVFNRQSRDILRATSFN